MVQEMCIILWNAQKGSPHPVLVPTLLCDIFIDQELGGTKHLLKDALLM